jgi:hypothetical protein
MTYNPNLGDVALTTEFADYAEADGMNLPRKITSKTDKYVVAEIAVSKHTINGDAGNLEAAADVKSAEGPTSGCARDGGRGGKGSLVSHRRQPPQHSREFADHLALIEAPQNEARTLAVIAKAKEIKPDKPLRFLVNTHHHFDHIRRDSRRYC